MSKSIFKSKTMGLMIIRIAIIIAGLLKFQDLVDFLGENSEFFIVSGYAFAEIITSGVTRWKTSQEVHISG